MSEFFGEDGFTSDDLGGLVDIGTQVWTLGEDIFGNSSDADTPAAPSPYIEPETDYTPYVIGGTLLLVVAGVWLWVRYRRRKKRKA